MRDEVVKEGGGQRSWFRGRHSAWIWLAAYFIYQTAAPFLQLPAKAPPWLIAATLVPSILGYLFLALAMLAALASYLRTPVRAAIALALGLFVWLIFPSVLLHLPTPVRGPLLGSVIDLGRSVAAAGIGALVASLIRDRNILLPATVFAAFADYLMVYTRIGTVNKALQTEGGQRMIRSMSAHVATAHPSIAAPSVGMADYVFLALFLACVYRFQMNERATFTAFFVALGLSLFFVLTGHALPALVPMGLAFVAANFRHFRLSRSELQAMGLAFGIVVVVVIGLFLFRR